MLEIGTVKNEKNRWDDIMPFGTTILQPKFWITVTGIFIAIVLANWAMNQWGW